VIENQGDRNWLNFRYHCHIVVTANDSMMLKTTSPLQSHLGRTMSPPLTAENEPTACASCAMPTADESTPEAAGTLHPHHTNTWQWHILRYTPNSNLANI